MRANDDILDLLREKGAEAARKAQRGVILQPGAIGDCILTLPLAAFMKDVLGLGSVDILGHSEYIGILPGRTCIDSISSIDSIELHRLFMETKAFDLKDRDPLINTFSGYSWIATFLGEPGSNFEQNLIFTANCSHSAEVITLSLKPPKGFSGHLTDFYIQHFISQSGLSELDAGYSTTRCPPQGVPFGTAEILHRKVSAARRPFRDCGDTRRESRNENRESRIENRDCLIKATEVDTVQGKELLKETGLETDKRLLIIQPGSGGPSKCWHMDNFLAVAKKISSKDIEVIFLLGPAELCKISDATIKNISSVARYLKDLSLTQVLGLLSCADAFVGNDSGITHLAAALGVRTLAVFGPTNPVVYKPTGPDVTVYANNTTAFAKKPSVRLQRELLDVLMA